MHAVFIEVDSMRRPAALAVDMAGPHAKQAEASAQLELPVPSRWRRLPSSAVGGSWDIRGTGVQYRPIL